jgi:hypothetical protein
LKLGATVEEIMEVLKLCVAQGVQACNLGVPILVEELAGLSTRFCISLSYFPLSLSAFSSSKRWWSD